MLKNRKEVLLDELMPVIREKLDAGGEVILLASGNSMYPLFRHRKDTVRLKKAEPGSLRKYDMILYQRDGGKYVLHRIVGTGERGFVLRGDHQYQDEYPVREEQVIAKVCGFCRGEREMSCECLRYRFYAVIWVETVHLRHIIVRVKNRIFRKKALL